jgi:hypothetical protein
VFESSELMSYCHRGSMLQVNNAWSGCVVLCGSCSVVGARVGAVHMEWVSKGIKGNRLAR